MHTMNECHGCDVQGVHIHQAEGRRVEEGLELTERANRSILVPGCLNGVTHERAPAELHLRKEVHVDAVVPPLLHLVLRHRSIQASFAAALYGSYSFNHTLYVEGLHTMHLLSCLERHT